MVRIDGMERRPQRLCERKGQTGDDNQQNLFSSNSRLRRGVTRVYGKHSKRSTVQKTRSGILPDAERVSDHDSQMIIWQAISTKYFNQHAFAWPDPMCDAPDAV